MDDSEREDLVRKRWTALLGKDETVWRDQFQAKYLAASGLAATSSSSLPSSSSLSKGALQPFQPLRSIHLAWSLGLFPPSSSVKDWISVLSSSREQYKQLRRAALTAPDGTLPEDLREELAAGKTPQKDWNKVNPLSLDEENPWAAHYASQELLQTIAADTARCFQDHALFRDERVQRGLTYLLFVWAKQNADVGYRQGMHELAGALWVARHSDAIRPTIDGSKKPDEIALHSAFVEHDTYASFERLMRTARSLFQWRAVTDKSSTSPTRNTAGAVAHYKPPIVARCERIASDLKQSDPLLSSRLGRHGVEPQVYLLRWTRLLLLREFPLTAVLELWDAMFAQDGGLELLDWVCIALLLRLRNRLLVSDQNVVLQALLRPSEEALSDLVSPTETDLPSHRSSPSMAPGSSPHHTPLLVTHAMALKQQNTPQIGIQCVLQNAELLGIPLQPPPQSDEEEDDAMRRLSGRRGGSHRGHRPTPPNMSPSSPSTNMLPEGLGDLARNLYARSDSILAGAQRTTAVGMGMANAAAKAYANAYARKSGVGSADDGFPSRMAEVERERRSNRLGLVNSQMQGRQSRPSMESRSFSQESSEVERLRSTNARMGAALDGIIEAFEAHWTSSVLASSPSAQPTSSEVDDVNIQQKDVQTLVALSGLKHIKDVLVGHASEFDESILQWPEEQDRTSASSPKPNPVRAAPSAPPAANVTTATSPRRRTSTEVPITSPPTRKLATSPVPRTSPKPSTSQHVSTGLTRTPQVAPSVASAPSSIPSRTDGRDPSDPFGPSSTQRSQQGDASTKVGQRETRGGSDKMAARESDPLGVL